MNSSLMASYLGGLYFVVVSLQPSVRGRDKAGHAVVKGLGQHSRHRSHGTHAALHAIISHMESTTTTLCSVEQITPLSKVLDSRMEDTARLTLAVSSMTAGVLPAPGFVQWGGWG